MSGKLTANEIRQAAEQDLEVFIRLLAPHLKLGKNHEDLIHWWQSAERKPDTMVLIPRAHLKSKLIAYKTAWEITRDPAVTILYVSATAALAEKQLHLIKMILTNPIYRKYWPAMVDENENKRERWTATEIAVDHPDRKKQGIRDPTVKATGLTGNITGFHATSIKLDDIVVPKNAYTEDGREKVRNLVSQLSSIKEPEATTDVVGTRYHPLDQYNTFQNQSYVVYNEHNEPEEEVFIWDVYLKVVEEDGVFWWPRQRYDDGKAYGFDLNVLSKIKTEYEDKTQFFAQYYNDPNDPGSERISTDKIQYYDRARLTNEGGRWHVRGQPLNVYAGLDFAFSLSKKADYTALVVVGIDPENNYYILDIDRFKTDRIKDYFDSIRKAYMKWGFKKIRCEVTTAQKVIVRDLRENYIRVENLPLVVDEFSPNRHEGNKEERIAATLEPKYDNRQIWHYKGGFVADLEEELTLARPAHDDIKDGLTAAIDIAVAPARRRSGSSTNSNIIFHSRFGGVAA